MHIIVCIDETKGMMFNNRRQSQDGVLREKVIELCKDSRLLMNEYSARQFGDYSGITVSNDYLSLADANDYCFIEDGVLPPAEKIENVIVFNWNRRYPSDVSFDFDLKQNGFKSTETEEFAGSSHEKITLEIYKRC
jgi:hypothetical protein